jgi:hypothetical protein
MTYGGTVPTLSGTVTGFVNGQTLASDGGWRTTATSSSSDGSYGISLSLVNPYSGDYTITAASGNSTALTIGKADLTATANTASMTYGGTVPTLSGTVTGFVNGQTLASDGGWSTTANSSSNVGSYGIFLSLVAPYSGDYTITNASGNGTAFTITAPPSTSGGGSTRTIPPPIDTLFPLETSLPFTSSGSNMNMSPPASVSSSGLVETMHSPFQKDGSILLIADDEGNDVLKKASLLDLTTLSKRTFTFSGVLKSMDHQTILVVRDSGGPAEYDFGGNLLPETKVLKGGKKDEIGSLKKGEKVTIKFRQSPDGPWVEEISAH